MLLSNWAIRCTANTLDNVKTPDIAGVAVSAVDCRLSRTNVSVVDDEHVSFCSARNRPLSTDDVSCVFKKRKSTDVEATDA